MFIVCFEAEGIIAVRPFWSAEVASKNQAIMVVFKNIF